MVATYPGGQLLADLGKERVLELAAIDGFLPQLQGRDRFGVRRQGLELAKGRGRELFERQARKCVPRSVNGRLCRFRRFRWHLKRWGTLRGGAESVAPWLTRALEGLAGLSRARCAGGRVGSRG